MLFSAVTVMAYLGAFAFGAAEIRAGYSAYKAYRSQRALGRNAKFRPLGKGAKAHNRFYAAAGAALGVNGLVDETKNFFYHAGCIFRSCGSREQEQAKIRQTEKNYRTEFGQRRTRRKGRVYT